MYEKGILKKEFWNPIRIWNRQFFVKNRFQEFFQQFLLLKKLDFFLLSHIIIVVTVATPKWRWRNIYGCMLLLGFFRTSMLYNRIWDDLVVLTFFYDTVRKVGMCAFILKRISRIILFSENCIFQTMTESPRLLVVKLCQCTIIYFPIIIFCLYSIDQKIIYLLFSFSFGLWL